MPYYIEQNNPDCKSGWAVISDAGTVHGCHTTKQSAIDQAVAISLATEEEFMGERSERALPDELAVGDTVAWVVETEAYAGVVSALMDTDAHVAVWDEEDGIWSPEGITAVVPIADLKKISPLVSEPEMPDAPQQDPSMPPLPDVPFQVASRAKWMKAAHAIIARLEGATEEARNLGSNEIRTNHIELRAEGDGRSFSGYASVFNQPSQPLPFIEYVKPGAFKRSLQSRNRMMLLWNHDTSNPLASTRNGSLQLTEDNVGLKVTATLPDTTLGRDIAELVRTGVIDSMSFGFSVKRDSWSNDGQTRYLEDVSLYEVSLVSTPAYEGTAGTVSVRSGISADVLADALLKIESGEELDPEQGALVGDVISRLTKTPEVEEVDGDILALKQKKLALLMMGIN